MHINAIIHPQASTQRRVFVTMLCLAALLLLASAGRAVPARASQEANLDQNTASWASQEISGTTYLHLPYIALRWPVQPPETPKLNPIDNADGDSFYDVAWNSVPGADTYTLEVSQSADFHNAVTAYQGSGILLSGGQSQLPGMYYYRVRANNLGGSSPWSEAQSITIYPMHVGLSQTWEGTSIIQVDYTETTGTHEVSTFDKMVDADTIRMSTHYWYAPNPNEWEEEYVKYYFTVSTGTFEDSEPEIEGDPNAKWGYSWRLAYGAGFTDGETVKVDGKSFTVRGPIWGNTKLGYISYWEFTNQGNIVVYDDGDGFTMESRPGEIVLRYETGPYGYLIYDSVMQHALYEGYDFGYYGRYNTELTQRSIKRASDLPAALTAAPQAGSDLADRVGPFGRPSLIRR